MSQMTGSHGLVPITQLGADDDLEVVSGQTFCLHDFIVFLNGHKKILASQKAILFCTVTLRMRVNLRKNTSQFKESRVSSSPGSVSVWQSKQLPPSPGVLAAQAPAVPSHPGFSRVRSAAPVQDDSLASGCIYLTVLIFNIPVLCALNRT